jgi:antitoxin CptB
MMAHLVSGGSQHDHSDVWCRRLLFRCWHRGTQESDLILGRFADAHLADFDAAQMDRFEALLDCTDPDLFDWIINGFAPPKEYDHDVMRLLRDFARQHNRKTNNCETITTTQE